MSTGSTLVAFKQALVDTLTGRPGLAGVQVAYEFQQDYVADQSIWIEGASASTTIPTMKAGTKRVEEDYKVTVSAQVLADEGQSQRSADDAALALLVEIQQVLAENPQLIPEILWAQIEGWEHHVGSLPKSDGHGSRFDIQVHAKARLYP